MKKNLRNSGKKFIAGTFMLGAFLAGAFAESPLNTSTGGMYSNDMDKIQNVNEWSNVNFEKFMASGKLSTSYLNLVGAFSVKDITIAPFFYGNGYYEYFNSTANDTKTYTVTDNIPEDYTESTSLDVNSNSKDYIYDTPGILVGYGNLGIKLTCLINNNDYFDLYDPATGNASTSSSTVTYDADGNKLTESTTDYELGKSIDETYNPVILAGYNLEAGGFTIKPYAGFGLNFSNSGLYAEKTVTTVPASLTTTTYTRDYRNMTFGLQPQLGANISKKGNIVTHVISADYSGTIDLYGSGYKDAEGTKQKADYFTGFTTVTSSTETDGSTSSSTVVSGTVNDKSYGHHNYNVGYSAYAAISDQLSLAGKAGVSGYFNSDSTKSYSVTSSKATATDVYGTTTTTKETSTGASSLTENFEYEVSPYLKGGVQYFIKPGKFAINGGVDITLPTYLYSSTKTSNPDYAKTTKTVSDTNGNTTEDSTEVTYDAQSGSKSVTSKWSAISYSLYTGFTWIMNEKFTVDTSTSVSFNDYISYNILYGAAIGCTLKF